MKTEDVLDWRRWLLERVLVMSAALCTRVLRSLRLRTIQILIVALAATLGVSASSSAQTLTPCPTDDKVHPLPAGTQCYNGQDANGAYYLIAIPPNYDGRLSLYCHGGPTFTYQPITPLQSANDLGLYGTRDVLNHGWAIAASSYSKVGWPITSDATDTDNLRKIFIAAFGQPTRTIVHGDSFGGAVSSIVAEKFAVDQHGTVNVDGVLTKCGLVVGGLRHGYLFSDQRTVYQHYCNNLPLPNETQYDLFHGVDDPNTTTPALVTQRVNACTGLNVAPNLRTPAQQAALTNIERVLTIQSDVDATARLTRGLFHLYDLTVNQHSGLNAFNSMNVQFHGSADDVELNANIARYPPVASAILAEMADSDPTGNVSIPVMTLHSETDQRAWPEQESAYRDVFEKAGSADRLLQHFTTDTDGGGLNGVTACQFSIPEFEAAFNNLNDWITTGIKPTRASVAAACVGDMTVCRFDTHYTPASWSTRQVPRSFAAAPSVFSTLSPLPNSGWNRIDVTVGLSATDQGGGVKQVSYYLTSNGGGPTPTADSPGATTSFVVNVEGTTDVTYYASDTFGDLSASQDVMVKLDKTAPVITHDLPAPVANGHGWNNTDVTVTFHCSDALSGVASCSTPAVISDEAANQSVFGGATDVAGNTAQDVVSGINIDKTAPTMSCSASPSVLWPPNHKLVPITVSVLLSDSLSGPDGFKLVSVTSNEPDSDDDIQGFVDEAPSTTGQLRAERLGSGSGRVYTLTYAGTDRAGNSATCNTTVTVPHERSKHGDSRRHLDPQRPRRRGGRSITSVLP